MSEHDRISIHANRSARLERARFVATALDESIRVPGIPFKVGLDPLLGIVPLLGDSVATIGSLYVVFVGIRLGVPRRKLALMVLRVAVDFLLGSVPVLGTLVDAVLKANVRNLSTIETHVADQTSESTSV